LNRIEVLEGPQGTLFGAGAEAGVIRYITNEPKLDVTEASVKAGYGVTAHGDPNSDVTAVLNLPVIAGRMAVRAVVYDDRRGGYIDNVPATSRARTPTSEFTTRNMRPSPDNVRTASHPVPRPTPVFACPRQPRINNNNLAARAINPVTYQGIRAECCTSSTMTGRADHPSYQNMDSRACSTSSPTPRMARPCHRSR